MAGEITEIALSEILTYRKGKATSRTLVPNVEQIPVLSPEYLRGNDLAGFVSMFQNLVLVEEGQLILLWDGSNAGEFFRAKRGVLASTMVAFDFDSHELNSDYLYYELKRLEPLLKSQTQGSGIPHVDKSVLLNHKIRKPAKIAQSAIAEVLSTIDRVIEQTETIIAKYQRIKTGLMHDLLTRGIDKHGQLRDPATHKFKPSPLGLIPEEWQLTTLGEVVAKAKGRIQTGPFGSQLHAREYVPDGVPVIMPQDMFADGTINLAAAAKITRERAGKLRRHYVIANDVVFARRGDLSRCVPIPKELTALCGTGCLLVRLPVDVVLAEWLTVIYKHSNSQNQVLAKAVGSTMINLNTGLLESLTITLPRIDEQADIVQAFQGIGATVQYEQQALDKLKRLRIGLLQDLLTGKVSVAPLLG